MNDSTNPRTPSLAEHPGVDDWISIDADGRVTVHTGKVDIGQRISTALAIIAAEELDVALASVRVARPRTGTAPDEGFTSGSNSMQESGVAVRLAAATVRRHLVTRAAARLGVGAEQLEVTDGLVRVRDTNRSVSFGELTGGAPLGIAVDPDVITKSPDAHRLVGAVRPVGGLEGLATGATRFVHDLAEPGTLHARVVRPPHYHARLEALDESSLASLGDVQVVRDGSFVAVASPDEYRAVRAVERVAAAATWITAPGLDTTDVFRRLIEDPRESFPVVDGVPLREPVPEERPEPVGGATLRARYERPYQMHASLAPSAARAHFDGETMRVWTHSQGIYPLRASLADVLDLPRERVVVEHALGSGCYGHNGADDAALDAALVARALRGKTVLLKWSREDEHAWEPYSSAMVVDLRADLDDSGAVSYWSHETFSDTHRGRPRAGPNRAGAGRLLASRYLADAVMPPRAEPNLAHHAGIHRNADPLYAFANRRIVKHLVRDLPLRVSAMRTLGAYANVFAAESFMDELAEAAGVDPLAFRLRHLEDPRAREVLAAAAQRMGMPGPAPHGRGRGLAFAQYKNSKAYAAVAVEASVDDAARVRLHRAVIAADAGEVVDREGLRAQLEGGFVQGASWTLHEAVRHDSGGITSRDWESYPILRFDEVPEIETIIVDRPGAPFLGAGEATSGPAAAAIANAVFAATGLRLRRLPLDPDAIRRAAMS